MSWKTSAVASALLALAGCSFIHSDSRPPSSDRVVAASYTGRAGQLVVPRVCKLDTAIVTRPEGHPAVEEAAWRAVDMQAIPPEVRRALSANGLRVGIITGSLPGEIADAFQNHPPQKTTEWVHFDLPESVQTPISVRPRVEIEEATGPDVVTMLVNNHGKVEGKDYADASGLITVTADQKGARQVTLRLVPSVQHGPRRGGFAAIQNAGPFAPQEFTYKNGQAEDPRRDLAVSLDIEPGQYVVVGCLPHQERSLGSFLFTRTSAGSDQMLQSLLLIQAGRNNVGAEPPKPDGSADSPAPAEAGPRPIKDLPAFEPKPVKDAPAR